MDEILNFAQIQIDTVESLKTKKKHDKVNGLISRNQILEELIQYEINFENEYRDFCAMVNSQLNQSCEEINKKLDSFGNLKLEKIVFKEGKTEDKSESNEEDEIKYFTNDINDIKQSHIETSELQLMMNCLPNYLDNINKEYINQEINKIENEKLLQKNQKIRALEFLYEMQDFCYGFMEVEEKTSKNKKKK